MSKQIFWITDGVYSNDEYRVITKANENIKYCVHCSNKNKKGFTAIGDKINYTICNNCLYKPSWGMINNNFIAISKTKDETRFNEILESCENKAEYLKIINETLEKPQFNHIITTDKTKANSKKFMDLALLKISELKRDFNIIIQVKSSCYNQHNLFLILKDETGILKARYITQGENLRDIFHILSVIHNFNHVLEMYDNSDKELKK